MIPSIAMMVLSSHANIHRPRIQRGQILLVDRILEYIEAMGVELLCADEMDLDSDGSLQEQFARMAQDEAPMYTDTLNLDRSVMITIISDISHSSPVLGRQHHSEILKNLVKKEARDPALRALLPILGTRSLQCTRDTAVHCKQVVSLLGTDTEKQRCQLLLGEIPGTQEELIGALQALCYHRLPSNLILPIAVVEEQADMPPLAARISPFITANYNRSSFVDGWARSMTTITVNKAGYNEVKYLIEKHRSSDIDWFPGPDIRVFSQYRSLLATEKASEKASFEGTQGGRHSH